MAAMKKEHARISRAAEKAKAEVDENAGIGSEFAAIHKEFADIVNSGRHDKETIKQLDDLKRRSDRADKILKKDILKLMDKQSDLELDRDALGSEIQMLEFRVSLRREQGVT